MGIGVGCSNARERFADEICEAASIYTLPWHRRQGVKLRGVANSIMGRRHPSMGGEYCIIICMVNFWVFVAAMFSRLLASQLQEYTFGSRTCW
jgi:hypothetical protein